ncbi:MAG: Listonella phage phiHSIC [Pseudomonadota bacterium]|jgi:hypothetical protein
MKPENTIKGIKKWFEAAVPEPTDKNIAVQLGVHVEEVAEMLTALGFGYEAMVLDSLADSLKSPQPPSLDNVDRKELLDSLCDQIVTATGIAHMFRMEIVGALREVDASNWSKFDEDGRPIFNENGKIAKGPRYFKPDLNPFI